MGDVHHLVPKQYLIRSGIIDPSRYNQVANYAFAETPLNIAIADRAPGEYMAIVDAQVSGTIPLKIGEIADAAELQRNLEENAIPADFREVTVATYNDFLQERRKLMAANVRKYYRDL